MLLERDVRVQVRLVGRGQQRGPGEDHSQAQPAEAAASRGDDFVGLGADVPDVGDGADHRQHEDHATPLR